MKVFQKNSDSGELELTREVHDHQGPIMDISFSPIYLDSYFITVGYDNCLNIYQLVEQIPEKKFTFVYDDNDLGFFIHVEFLNEERNLSFLITTSQGFILKFSSKSKFKEEKFKVLEEQIDSLSVSQSNLVLIASQQTKRLYLD